MLLILYVFKFNDINIEKAIKRLNCSLQSLVKQSDRIFILNASETCIKHKLINSDKIKYIHKPYNQYFNKSVLINWMVKNCLKDYDYFIFSDIDLVYEDTYIYKMKSHIKGKDFVRVVPYNVNMAKEFYANTYKELDDQRIKLNLPCAQGWAHGNGLIHVPSFMRIRGYNEAYKGYAAEDQDFNLRLSKINKLIYDRDIKDLHIWHENFNREFSKQNSEYYDLVKSEVEKGKLIFNNNIWGEY